MSDKRLMGTKPSRAEIPLSFPVVFFDCHDSVIENDTGLTVLKDVSGDYFGGHSNRTPLPLYSGGSIGTEWSAKPGWYSFSGANNVFRALLSNSISDEYRDALELAENALLLWGQIETPSSFGSGSDTIIGNGRDFDAAGGAGFNLQFDNSSPRIRVRLIDEEYNLNTLAPSSDMDSTSTVFDFVVFIDNRGGQKTITFYTNGDFSGSYGITVGSVPWIDPDPHANQSVSVGATFTAPTPSNQCIMPARRLGCVNYGQTPPSNIPSMARMLHANGSIPGFEFSSTDG